MEIKDIEYVKAILDHGSVTKAAQALYITQPSLSTYLKNMQERLGFEVFIQNGKRFELTYLGEEFLKYGLQILTLKEDFYDQVQNILDNRFGRLKIAIPLLRSSYLVPVLLPIFKTIYPNVDIELNESSSAQFPQLIQNGDVDLALMNRTDSHPALHTEKIKSEEILIALPAQHPLCQKVVRDEQHEFPIIDLQDLADEVFILHQPDQFSRQVSDKIFKTHHFTPKKILATRNIETATNLVANNQGVCFINHSHTKHIILADKIKFFSLRIPFYVELIVAYRKQRQLPSYAKNFIDICKETI